ncbi:ice-binding family protein, partial [Streptomyces europaeiscabiei]|uniref:ice-binding family protein n=1 Tax=Streptomyces europaeiscabiei TaxID=146819 RepID=UPI0029B94E2C
MTVVDAPSPLRSRPRINRRLKARLAVVPGVVLLATATLAWFTTAQAAEAPVPLGTAESYAILAGSTITNTGDSDIIGDVGLSPGTDVTGFPPGEIFGALNIANGAAGTAKMDLTAAYNNAAGRTGTAVAVELGGRVLGPGVYSNPTLGITGELTLNAQGDPNAVFIFQTTETLITASNSSVKLINGAQPCNVFWKVGSSATLGTDSDFVGTIMALASITLNTGADIQGRAFAQTAAVTLDNNDITRPFCVTGPTGPTGPAGPAGPAGPTGPPGPSGSAGPAGPEGAQGDAGPAGPAGPSGPAGPAGPSGPAGPVGPEGAQGDAGPAGPAGPSGPAGPVGPEGAQGDAGPAGPVGPSGPAGPVGPEGAQGDTGPAGPEGAKGDTGPEGAKGDTGPEGAKGDTGPEGAKGDTGPEGA